MALDTMSITGWNLFVAAIAENSTPIRENIISSVGRASSTTRTLFAAQYSVLNASLIRGYGRLPQSLNSWLSRC
jgi:hypothetical protein